MEKWHLISIALFYRLKASHCFYPHSRLHRYSYQELRILGPSLECDCSGVFVPVIMTAPVKCFSLNINLAPSSHLLKSALTCYFIIKTLVSPLLWRVLADSFHYLTLLFPFLFLAVITTRYSTYFGSLFWIKTSLFSVLFSDIFPSFQKVLSPKEEDVSKSGFFKYIMCIFLQHVIYKLSNMIASRHIWLFILN